MATLLLALALAPAALMTGAVKSSGAGDCWFDPPAAPLAWFAIEAVEAFDLTAFYADYRSDGHGRHEAALCGLYADVLAPARRRSCAPARCALSEHLLTGWTRSRDLAFVPPAHGYHPPNMPSPTRQIPMNQRVSKALVTGCAGFLGSHLSEALLSRGVGVLGVDCFSDYYPRRFKQSNVAGLRAPGFELVEADLATAPLDPLLDGIDVVFHLAAQPGVRGSFGEGFGTYLRHNVQATQRLLEAASRRDLSAFVYASSSSVYGNQPVYPARENAPVDPVSPYGATKVITEQLATAFWRSAGVPAVGLRYFTVYGPRQRPDMAFSRFISRALTGRPLVVRGDGRQVREFTYIADVVRATLAAAGLGEQGTVYNVGGGQPVALLDVIALLEELVDRPITVVHTDAAPGDPRRTEADVERARRDLGYRPATPLSDGLAAQIEAVSADAIAVEELVA